MSGAFPTQRSIQQVIRRHTPGSLIYIQESDLIGYVREIQWTPDQKITDKRRLAEEVRRKLGYWQANPNTRIRGVDPNAVTAAELVAGRPMEVKWMPLGSVYVCRNRGCEILNYADEHMFSGKCWRCKSELGQLEFVFYHSCGAFQAMRPTRDVTCPDHQRRTLYFHDTGKFGTSQWRCRECDYQRRFSFPVCGDSDCAATNRSFRQFSGSFWRDQWVHYSVCVNYINIDEITAKEFVKTVGSRELVVRSTLGTMPAGRDRLKRALAQDSVCPSCSRAVSFDAKFCPECGTPMPQKGIVTDQGTGLIDTSDGRTVWAILRDMTDSRSLRDDVEASAATTSMQKALASFERCGISDVVLCTNFPLVTAAIGFTRDRPNNSAWLRAFPKTNDDKTLVYTNGVETEAWLVQLSGAAVVEWLARNAIAPSDGCLPVERNETECKRWLIERILAGDSEIVDAVRPLLHSYSHVALLSISIAGGLEPSSLGELLLLEALAFVVYAGESDLGSLVAAYEQSPDVVMFGLDDYVSCKFDPACTHDDGGACVGCVHLSRGCENFNEELSRGYLYGGPVKADHQTILTNGFFAVAGVPRS